MLFSVQRDRISRAFVQGRTQVKVPDATAAFWVTKILSTGMGEATSDFLVHRFDQILSVALVGIVFAGSLLWQFWVRRYVALIYWFAVVMVSVFGTMVADVIHVGFGVPYRVSVAVFAVTLAVILTLWHRCEKTLSIHSIRTPARETFYWATVLATFALGTAVGDLTATTLHLGYLASGLLFASVILIPALAYWQFGMPEVTAFWFAYIVTRPLGASFADWLGKPTDLGGLGCGDGVVSLVASMLILGCVAYLTWTQTQTLSGGAAAAAEEG